MNEVKHENAEIILGIIRDLNGNTYFLRDFEISHQESRERDQELSRIAVEAIKLANTNYCVEIFSVVSKEFTLLNHLDSKVSFVPCNIKIANLVAESLIDTAVYGKVKLILNHCEQYESVSMLLQTGSYKEILPVIDEEFCWSKHLHAYYIFLKNVKVLRQKVGDGEINLGPEFTTLVFDELLKQDVKNLEKTYTPLVELMQKFGRNDFFIADTVVKIYTF